MELHHLLSTHTSDPHFVDSALPSASNSLFDRLRPLRMHYSGDAPYGDPGEDASAAKSGGEGERMGKDGKEAVTKAAAGEGGVALVSGAPGTATGASHPVDGGGVLRCVPPLIPACFYGFNISSDSIGGGGEALGSEPSVGCWCWDSAVPRPAPDTLGNLSGIGPGRCSVHTYVLSCQTSDQVGAGSESVNVDIWIRCGYGRCGLETVHIIRSSRTNTAHVPSASAARHMLLLLLLLLFLRRREGRGILEAPPQRGVR